MLVEVHCEKFRETPICLHAGLNVVMGDNAATNSIGKSTFLMVIDFLMGGDTFIKYNRYVVDELGNHKYFAKYLIDDKTHVFCRETGNPEVVFMCSESYEILEPMEIRKYRKKLNQLYQTENLGLTFRAVVSPFSRVWGKTNLDPKKPLDSHTKSASKDALKYVLKLYERYGALEPLEKDLIEESNKKNALRKAQGQNLIPKISVKQYRINEVNAKAVDDEIADIKSELSKYATNLRELATREVAEIKESKDRLLEARAQLNSRLHRINTSLANNSYIKSRSFHALKDFFPEIDEEKIAEVEGFHSSISKILRNELNLAKQTLQMSLEQVNTELGVLDDKLSLLLKDVENPGLIVDRVYDLARKKQTANIENNYHEKSQELAEKVKNMGVKLNEEKKIQLAMIQVSINGMIQSLSSDIYGPGRKCPYLSFKETNYSFEIFEDTGTGRAYSNLVLLDLAILNTSRLPFVVHDSLLFKNVENDAVSKMFAKYIQLERQAFVSIDEIDKYGTDTAAIIEQNTVLRLSNNKVLYTKDWRSNERTKK